MTKVPEDKILGNKQLTLSDQVFERFQTDIVKGFLPSGKKLSESELSTTYGVSRGPLREAIRRLESRGLIVKRPHAGISVVSLSFNELIDIYLVREALEGMACRLAAQHMTDTDIAELRRLLVKHREMITEDEGRSYYQQEGDFDFHYRIITGSGNAKLHQLLWHGRLQTTNLLHFLLYHRLVMVCYYKCY